MLFNFKSDTIDNNCDAHLSHPFHCVLCLRVKYAIGCAILYELSEVWPEKEPTPKLTRSMDRKTHAHTEKLSPSTTYRHKCTYYTPQCSDKSMSGRLINFHSTGLHPIFLLSHAVHTHTHTINVALCAFVLIFSSKLALSAFLDRSHHYLLYHIFTSEHGSHSNVVAKTTNCQ